ncbi:MAG: diguanylate cyclase [Gammaproteobacteria bacterium]|nr:diguanylate cyclase [Gammaproteobacteria bacterium]
MVKNVKSFRSLWSTIDFSDPELCNYASSQLLDETRRGLKTMSLLFFVLIVIAAPIYVKLDLSPIYFYTYSLVAVLCAHIYISANRPESVNDLYVLGITLLTVSATAYLSIAHQTSSFNIMLFANVVLLFMAVPMVPWGVREALIAVSLIYFMFTFSTTGMTTRFGSDTLLVLQFLMLATASVSLLLVARNVKIRKKDLNTRFDLEKTRNHLFLLSNVDPLTGAWNRRYLQTAINGLLEDFEGNSKSFHYAILDLDDFKILNDTYGHDFGDEVLKVISSMFISALRDKGYLLRFGGDEFVLIFVSDDPQNFVDEVIQNIERNFRESSICSNPVTLSYGLVSAPLSSEITSTALYHSADQSLYRNKNAVHSQEALNPSALSIQDREDETITAFYIKQADIDNQNRPDWYRFWYPAPQSGSI